MVSLYPASMAMQAVDEFVSSFSTQKLLIIHMNADTFADDVLALGLLTSHIPNYVSLPGNEQNFCFAYMFEMIRVIVIIEGSSLCGSKVSRGQLFAEFSGSEKSVDQFDQIHGGP